MCYYFHVNPFLEMAIRYAISYSYEIIQDGVLLPIKYQHRKQSNTSEAQGNKIDLTQDGRSRQSKNNISRCLLKEITNSQDYEESESQHSSQLSEQVNYGTQPEERMESIVDYDWDEDRKIKYLCDENGLQRV